MTKPVPCSRRHCPCGHTPPCVAGYIDELEHYVVRHGQRYLTAVRCPTCHPGAPDLDVMRAELELFPVGPPDTPPGKAPPAVAERYAAQAREALANDE